MRYVIKLSYNGREFHGWQTQPNAPSIQKTLEKALSTLLRRETPVTGAGRTDACVSAVGYIAHFDSEQVLDAGQIRYKLNAILPRSIVVLDILPCGSEFHSRFDATRREYTYFLHRIKDPFVESFSFLAAYPKLDFEAMNRAAKVLLGRHDFACFEKTGADAKTSICTITQACWYPYTPTICSSGIKPYSKAPSPWTEPLVKSQDGLIRPSENYWYFRIAADRFLRNMVRAIVGTLLEVGRGKRSYEDFAGLILEPEAEASEAPRKSLRCAAGESVPGHALFLSEIDYPEI